MTPPPKVKPSVRTIASELGLSAITVSRTLNGHPLVSPETRRKVMEKVKEVGYDFEDKSRTLRLKREQNVAIHCGDDKLQSDRMINFYMNLHYLCVRRLKAEKLCGRLVDFNGHEAAAFEALEHCASLLLLGPIEPEKLARIRNGYPKVCIVSVFGDVGDVTQVGPDDYEGGALAAKEFDAHGHRRVMVFANLAEETFRKRCSGFRAELLRLRPDAEIDLIEFGESHSQQADDRAKTEALDRYFAAGKSPVTGCFVPNGYAGVFLAEYLKTRGISIPAAVSVVTYDNLEIFRFQKPELCRVWFDQKALAAQAIDILRCKLSIGGMENVKVLIPNQLTPGESLAAVK